MNPLDMRHPLLAYTLLVVIAIAAPIRLLAAEAIPNTLEEAFVALDHMLSPDERRAFMRLPEERAVVKAHFGIGMTIRNQWFRSGQSKLPALLQAQHLDDASAIVLTAYWRHLNDKPLELDRQIACYRRWWQEQRRIEEAARAQGQSRYGMPAFSCPEPSSH